MRFLLILFWIISLAGCATTPDFQQPAKVYLPPAELGIYHQVHKGETLWRLSKVYDVDMQRLIDVNQLPNASRIEVGQLIFIPGAQKKIEISGIDLSKYEKDAFIWPVEGRVVSFFGKKNNSGIINKGIDIQTQPNTDVGASRSGVVLFTSDKVKGFGNTIILDHEDGCLTLYANNSINLVRPGQRVQRGQIIAKTGITGRAGTPTLHFQIRKAHKPQNPFYFLPQD